MQTQLLPPAVQGCSDIGGRVSPPFDQFLLNVTPKKEHLPGAAAQELACLLSARRGMPTQAVCYRPSPFPQAHREEDLKDNSDKDQA